MYLYFSTRNNSWIQRKQSYMTVYRCCQRNIDNTAAPGCNRNLATQPAARHFYTQLSFLDVTNQLNDTGHIETSAVAQLVSNSTPFVLPYTKPRISLSRQ